MSTDTSALVQQDAEQVTADAAEGLYPASDEVLTLRGAYKAQSASNRNGTAALKAVRDDLGAHLVGAGPASQALTHNGSVVVRLSTVTSYTLDTAKIRKEDPELFATLFEKYGKTTVTERINVY